MQQSLDERFQEIKKRIEQRNYPDGWGATSLRKDLARILKEAVEREEWELAKTIATTVKKYFEKIHGFDGMTSVVKEVINILAAKNQNLAEYYLEPEGKLYQYAMREGAFTRALKKNPQ